MGSSSARAGALAGSSSSISASELLHGHAVHMQPPGRALQRSQSSPGSPLAAARRSRIAGQASSPGYAAPQTRARPASAGAYEAAAAAAAARAGVRSPPDVRGLRMPSPITADGAVAQGRPGTPANSKGQRATVDDWSSGDVSHRRLRRGNSPHPNRAVTRPTTPAGVHLAEDGEDLVATALRRSSSLQVASGALAERRRGIRAASEAGGLRARSTSLRAGARSSGGDASAHKGGLVVRKRGSSPGDKFALIMDEVLGSTDTPCFRSRSHANRSAAASLVGNTGTSGLGVGSEQREELARQAGASACGAASDWGLRLGSGTDETPQPQVEGVDEPYAPYSTAPIRGPGCMDLMRECHDLTSLVGIDDDWLGALCGSDTDSEDGESIWQSGGAPGAALTVC